MAGQAVRRRARPAALAAVLAVVLAGCSVSGTGDVEGLLRAPQLSGEGSALQKALNSYLGTSATLKYPASGDFLSPFSLGDWDGDGDEEAAVLYTVDSGSTNAWVAVLEQTDGGWRVTQTAEGLSGEVESFTAAHLRDADSLQMLAGYGSAQGDRYLVVYQYQDETLQTVIMQSYTDMILADLTGGNDTEDLILALPTETENSGVTLQLLTTAAETGEFRSVQTLALGAGSYNGCAGLHAGQGTDQERYLVMDAWVGGGSLVSAIILYDAETASLQSYQPQGSDLLRTTKRYDANLLSRDIDGNGTVDIPMELDDGGTIQQPMDRRLRFLLWRDYTGGALGGNSCFGVYDTEYRFFVPLPESMHGSVQLRGNQSGTGWLICNAEGTSIYAELRVVDPSDDPAADGQYTRVANIGSQQLQLRLVTSYPGLTAETVTGNIVFMD